MTTISRDQFKRLAGSVASEAANILRSRDKSDKAMDKKSALLQMLYQRLQIKLGINPVKAQVNAKGFKTYEFAYREAIYALLSERAKSNFHCTLIVNTMLDAS